MTRRDDMKFDPTTGTPWGANLLPMHPDTFRKRNPKCTWLFNPWTGVQRDTKDVVDNPRMEQVAPPFPPLGGVLQQENATGHFPEHQSCTYSSVAVEVDPTGRDAHTPGAKMDSGKPRVWLCVSGFSRALGAVADVTTRGAEKYAPNSWMEVPEGAERYMEGFARHALALGRGETHDTGPGGTGCLHKAQMIWNLLASLELELRRDDGWAK